jgi:hypothetical protein
VARVSPLAMLAVTIALALATLLTAQSWILLTGVAHGR